MDDFKYVTQLDQVEQLRAQNLRLRNVLTRIVERCDLPIGPGRSAAINSIALIAAKALREEE